MFYVKESTCCRFSVSLCLLACARVDDRTTTRAWKGGGLLKISFLSSSLVVVSMSLLQGGIPNPSHKFNARYH